MVNFVNEYPVNALSRTFLIQDIVKYISTL